VLNDVEVAIEVVEVIVVVETVVVEVNDVEMDVEVAPPTITMLVKPTSFVVLLVFPVTVTVYVPGGAAVETNEPVIAPLPGPVIEQEVGGVEVGLRGVGVFTVIAQLSSKGLNPDPVTVTKNPGPTWLGDTETVGKVTVKVAVPIVPPVAVTW
jgi:hypothetical protein